MLSHGQGANFSQTSFTHRLVGPERWFASWVLERQRTHRTPAILKMEANYGREGIALMAASAAIEVPASLITMCGIVFLVTSGDRGMLLNFAYWAMGTGIAIGAVGLIRIVQGGREGRRFRDGPDLSR